MNCTKKIHEFFHRKSFITPKFILIILRLLYKFYEMYLYLHLYTELTILPQEPIPLMQVTK